MKEIASIDKKNWKIQILVLSGILYYSFFYRHRVIMIQYFKGEKFNLGKVNGCLEGINLESIFRNFYEKIKW